MTRFSYPGEISRRRALLSLGSSALGLWAPLSLWAPGARAAEEARDRKKVLVHLQLRGGLDGLHAIVPLAEDAYFRRRPSLAIQPPFRDGGALSMTDEFGLHPKLEPLLAVFLEGELAIVPAAGLPGASHSHFEVDGIMQLGTSGDERVQDGWVNRLAQARGSSEAEGAPISVSGQLPVALRGSAAAHSLERLTRKQRTAKQKPVSGPEFEVLLESLYAGSEDPFSRAATSALHFTEYARKRLRSVRTTQKYSKQGSGLRDAARLVLSDLGVELLWVEVGGFDTHRDQRNGLAKMFDALGQDLWSFRTELGDRWNDVVLVTSSEFGRTLAENGAGGTDHGHASSMFVLGGAVRGGRILGRWPGLAPHQLRDQRELMVTTDYRTVFSELLVGHLGLDHAALSHVFPGFDANPDSFLGLV